MNEPQPTEPQPSEGGPAGVRSSPRRTPLRSLLPIGALALGALVAWALYANQPKPQRRAEPPRVVEVEVEVLSAKPYQVQVSSQGTVRAHTRAMLATEVAGRVEFIAPAFQDGASVSAGQVLVRLDPSEYQLAAQELETQVQIVSAGLAELAVDLESSKGRIALAKERVTLQASQLARVRALRAQGVANEGQLLDAQDRELAAREALAIQLDLQRTRRAQGTTLVRQREAAEARLAAAQLSLARTTIKAPFDAQVVRRRVSKGQFLARGGELGEIYASDSFEVRLLLSAHQLSFVDILGLEDEPVKVILSAKVGSERFTWEGKILRAEGVVDSASRQVAVIAEVPSQKLSDARPFLRPGAFVSAKIQGRVLPDAFVIPRSASAAQDLVLIVDAQGVLRRRPLKVAWREAEHLVVTGGLAEGERLCTTPLVFAGDSLQVQVKVKGLALEGQPPGKGATPATSQAPERPK